MAPLLVLTACWAITGCIRDGGNAPASQQQPQVGNYDPRGVDDQPDWDEQARALKQRIAPRMPATLPSDKRAACEAMLDEASGFYEAVEGNVLHRAALIAQLAQARASDVDGCMRESSVAAVVCVTILLRDRDSEFPWLLDQCSRAYPNEGADDGPPAAAVAAKAESIELTFVGDIIFGRYREDNVFDPIVDPSKVKADAPLAGPFAELEAQLRSDALVGNLETPVIEVLPDKSPIGSTYRFGGGRADVKLLADAGFAVLSLANNHYFDLREQGQLQTPKILAEEGIFPIGAGRTEDPLYRVETLEVKGWKLGFVAVTNRINAPVRAGTPQVPYIELRDMVATLGPLVQRARADHDLIILAVHWGDEYEEAPSSYHRTAAHGLIDAGVDLIMGHHPHVLQGIERYNDGLIAYSLGNFLFEHTGAIPRLTGVLRVRWGQAGCLDDVVFHPAYMTRTPYPHPTVASGGMGKQVRKRVVSQAKALGSDFVEVGGSEDLRLAGVGCGGS